MPGKKKRLKVRRIPEEVIRLAKDPDAQKTLPTPVKDLCEAIALGKVDEIVLIEPEPTLWDRLVKWFSE